VRKLLKTAALIITSVIMLLPTTFAMSRDDIPGLSVYAPPSEQEEIYEIILNSERMMEWINGFDVTLVKESITPFYRAYFLEYAETGVFRIVSPVMDRSGRAIDAAEGERGNVYYVKTVTAEGLFAANIRFYMEDGIAYPDMLEPTPALEEIWDFFRLTRIPPSKSYADHAERIRQLLGRDTFVPTDQVRYLGVDHLGKVFYINDGEIEALVVISADDTVFWDETGEGV